MSENSESPPHEDSWDGLTIQTTTALVAVLGGAFAVGSSALRWRRYPDARCVAPLWRQLQCWGGPLQRPILPFKLNPYKELTPHRALILQGGEMEGKTTLLRTSIPSSKRGYFGGYWGIYLNGSHGRGIDSWPKWHTSQLLGSGVVGATEIGRTLEDYFSQQRIRSWLHSNLGICRPKPAFVIVDEFEELLKRFPQALDWANTLTNLHVRNDVARVVFVVNSDAGAQTLLNLNQGIRFKHVVMDRLTGDEAAACGVDKTRFEKCKQNIGLYKHTKEVALQELEKEADWILRRWADDLHLPFPLKYNRSWRRLPKAKATKLFLKELRKALEAGNALHNKERVDEGMRLAERRFACMPLPGSLDTPQLEFQEEFESLGASWGLAKQLARLTRQIVGNPAPEVPPDGGK